MRRTAPAPAAPSGTRTALRLLGPDDLADALRVADREPVAAAVVIARIAASRLDPWKLGGELWGWYRGGELRALCYAGANLVPVRAGSEAVAAFADRARRQGRSSSAIVGPAAPVDQLWRLLRPEWGPARAVRTPQPLLAVRRPADTVAPDPRVRRVRPEEFDRYLPACVEMFTEEVGVSPLTGQDGGRLYRTRVAELIATGRAFASFDAAGRVLFKAEVGAVTPRVSQIQGVWTAPRARGRGVATRGMAAVVRASRAEFAPVVSLYVNEFNTAARLVYQRVGFRTVGTMTTVMF